jgi:hypoxanthine phosphoribosyltransferase
MVLYNEEQIRTMVDRVAEAIVKDAKNEEMVLVILLKGGAWFGVDLSRALEKRISSHNLYVEFMRVASYGDRRESSGDVRIEMDIERSVRGRNVIIVDEVADTRNTLAKVKEHLLGKEPRSLKICVAVDKTAECRRPEVALDYVGFSNVEGFLVGYGMDDKGTCRGVSQIELLS